LGAWHDVGWWQLELAPRVGTPAPPLALPRLLAEAPAEVGAALAMGLGHRAERARP
jgi:hypothetical protein